MKQPRRWRSGVVASAVALLAGMATLPAHALSLGKISVLSALGEPLRAEIDVPQITPEEASSLKAAVATPDAFKAAGLEYTQVLAGLDVTLQRRVDGRSYLRLTSSRPVSEPFVDLVLQASWSAGRLTRDYTMLFDPPGMRSNATAVAPTAPVLSRPSAPPAAVAAPRTRDPIAARPSAPATTIRPEAAAKAPAIRTAPAESVAGDKQVTVRPGDTAGKIAAQNKPGVVSLDQMLVALLRSNPNAFIDGNVNRIKAGAVLDMPGADAAGAISASEASQTIVAQSKDFNAFRRKLAEGVANAQVGNAERQAGGKVQAKVEDRAPAVAAPDKLTLSKGAVQAKTAAAEDAIAKSRQASETSARVAELSKNISDLNKLGGAPGAAAAPTGPTPSAPPSASTAAPAGATSRTTPGIAVPAPSAVAPTVKPPVPAPSPVASPAPAPALAASVAAPAPQASVVAPAAPASSAVNPAVATSAAMTPASTPSASDAAVAGAAAAAAVATAPEASTPAERASAATAPQAVVAPKVVKPVAPPPETRLLDDLMENPLVLPLAAGLLALLAGLGIYSYRRKNASAQVDSSFLESRLQPDSFFGASGGQRIDTNEASPTGSSLVYSPSQLDAAGDVDPVAEADVYLAYGRDLQAEEILKEALRTNPARVAIHAKLAEIHAKRRDSRAFEAIALEAFNLTRGHGPEWSYMAEMGRELEPSNPLYQPGVEPTEDLRDNSPLANSAPVIASPRLSVEPGPAVVAASSFAATATPTAAPAAEPVMDVDLDLDFPLGGLQDGHTSPAPIAALVTAEPDPAPVLDKLDMDFSDISSKPIALTYPVPISKITDAGRAASAQPNGSSAAAAAVLPDSGMLEFDLDSLSLDLNGPNSRHPAHDPAEDDPLNTKFLLAEEFRSLGDPDGARSLAEEVLAQAQGPLKVKAQAFLNALA